MMPIEQVTRAVTIDDLCVCVSAWRYICDDCGRRDTFPDIPMPEGRSEFEASHKGWGIWFDALDQELCRCPNCRTKERPTVTTGKQE